MTHSKIRYFVVLAIVLLLFQVAVCEAVESVPSNDESHREDVKISGKDNNQPKEEIKQHKDASVVQQDRANKTGNITSKHAAGPSATTIQPAIQHVNEMDIASLNTGALKRAVIVTFGLCGLVMMYIVFRSLRVNKSRPQMVRKYGILAHRQDVEMRPLPLDEDDEDDTTVFDASNISAQRLDT